MFRLHRVFVACLLLTLLLPSLGVPSSSAAGTPATGYAASDFATGFPSNGAGPIGLAFDSSNNLFVGDIIDGNIYKFGPGGGALPAPLGPAVGPLMHGLAFDKLGNLYVARASLGDIVQVDTSSSQIIREVATSIPCPTALATDPLSGDLFVSGANCGDGTIWRISNPTGTNGVTTGVSAYTSPGVTDGMTFGPDGTLFTETDGWATSITGTNQPQPPVVTQIVAVPNIDGIAVAANRSNPSQPAFLFANRTDGVITKIDLTTSPPTLTDVVTGGSRGDFVAVGPDGCLYATQSASIEKVTNADGSCSLAPSSGAPQLTLSSSTPPSATSSAGAAQSFTANFSNVANPGGIPVTFTVTGANPQTQTVSTNSSGTATFSYAGAKVGTDTVVATATVNGAAVTSNPWTVTWGGLVSWWKADGTADDSVGPENGTAQGGLAYVPGVQGQAFSFNGTDAAVNLPTTSLPSYPNPWSITGWVSTTATDERYILFYGNGQDWMSNAVSLGMLNGNLMTTQGGDNLNSGFIADGALHYVAVTFDGTSHRLYVDGQLVGTKAMATVSSPVTYAAIGRSVLNIQPQYGNPSFWSGLVDDLQLYNRDLSGTEIKAAYAAVNAATVLATGPVLTPIPGTTPGFPASPYPYASTAITVDPYPPTQGQAVTLGALLQNPTNAAITLASVDFAFSGYGLGLAWQPVGSVANVTIPAAGIVNGTTTPGTAHPTLQWTPPFSGHHCVQVTLHYADGSVQVLQRNIDIIGFSGGGPVSTTFQVGDPVGAGTVTLKVVPVDQSPSGWTATLDQSSLTLAAGQLQNVNLTITPPAGAPNGSFAIYNVEGYVGSILIGGISKRVDISSGVQTPLGAPTQLTLASNMPSGGTVAGTPPNVTLPTFTASLTGGSPTSGVPVAFAVTGANPQTKTVSTDSTGTATFSYTGTKAWADTIVASATINGTAVTSNPLTVMWGVPAPVITNLVPGGYVPGGRSTITGHTVSSGHIRCTHRNGTDVWETDADADGNWSLAIDLSGDGDGEDILYIEDGSGGGYFHIYAGGGGGFRIIVDSTGGGADFHVTGSAGGGVNNVYLGDAGVGIAAILGGGSASDSYKIYWSASGDDTVDWTEVDSGPCGCIPDGGITFHRVGSRTLSYYIVDRYGHRGPTRQRVIRNKAPMAISNVAVTPGTFSTATTTVTGGTGQRATITYTLSEAGTVSVRIVDGSGSIVRTLVNGESRPGGVYNLGDVWDGKDDGGALVSNCGCHVQVEGVDATGNPAKASSGAVVVDSTAPTASITSGPAAATNQDTPFVFTGTDPAVNGATSGIDHFVCRLDNAPYASCQSGLSFPGQPEGSHTFSVRAVDGAGNVGQPAAATWLLDRTPPVITVSGITPGGSYSTTITPTVSVADPNATNGGLASGVDPAKTVITLDGKPFTTGSHVADVGPHTLVVNAFDRAGNSASQTVPFSVTHPTTLVITSANAQPNGMVTVTAKLTDGVTGQPVAGGSLTFTLGSQTFTGTTDASGAASVTVPLEPGQFSVGASFGGVPQMYLPSRGTQTLYVYQPAQFVIWGANRPYAYAPAGQTPNVPNINLGQDYTFWGAQWETQVQAGDYTSNGSFKGYADTADFTNGFTWTSRPGSASRPPATVGTYIGVIVATHATKGGSTESGNIAEIVVLRVDDPAAYAPDAGHPASGVAVATARATGH